MTKPMLRYADTHADSQDVMFRAPLSFILDDAPAARPGRSPTMQQELSFITGLTEDGKITDTSFWGSVDSTAFKWGNARAGTGATITYSFDAGSHFTATEKATFVKAMAMWSALADVTFKEVKGGNGNVLLQRGDDGGAWASTDTTDGRGAQLGRVQGQATISIDTSTPGFDLSGDFNKVAGYGLSTVIHEIGHLLGLGHAGAYNGNVNPATQQFSAFDDRMYSIMSYISWTDWNAKYLGENPIQGTYWGSSFDGYLRSSPSTPMLLDIVGIQQLYGESNKTPFTGGQTYGFNCNIQGVLHDFYDFTVNSSPVVTIYNQGTGNVLDISGWSMTQWATLAEGGFSSVGGLFNNVFIQFGTRVDTLISGAGDDTLIANGNGCTLIGGRGDDTFTGGAGADVIIGGSGWDYMTGGAGADRFVFDRGDSAVSRARADVILDFSRAEGDRIDLTAMDANTKTGANEAFVFIGKAAFSGRAGELHFEVAGGDAFVSGDTNGDGKADFMIRVDEVTTFVAGDFAL